MIKLVMSAYPISKLNIPDETIVFNIDSESWPDLVTTLEDKATFLYMAIIADRINKEYYDEEYLEENNDSGLAEVYKNLNDVDNYEERLKEILENNNIKYEFNDENLDAFEEDYSEFSQCALDVLEEYDFYNPKVLYKIMETENSLLNFLFSNESGIF